MSIILISSFAFVIVLIIALLIHHAITHEGRFFDFEDFSDGFKSIFKSHESIILILIVILIGIVI